MNDKVFRGLYANLYDSFHAKKNYALEVTLLLELLSREFPHDDLKFRKILDFGCGTGKHMYELIKLGYRVSGFDLSEDMLRIGKTNHPEISFHNKTAGIGYFDLVYSLFDVSSYQLTDDAFQSYLYEMNQLLLPGGILVFDGWHSSGVSLSPPENRKMKVVIGNEEVAREVLASHSAKSEITELVINIVDLKTEKILTSESHLMRSFSKELISNNLEILKFDNIKFFDGTNIKLPLRNDSWRFFVVARKHD